MTKFSKVPAGGPGYPYVNARVRVMKSRLIEDTQYERLLKMGLAEIAKFLEETEYSREINELGAAMEGAELLEYALSKNLENTFTKLIKIAITGSKDQLRLYLHKWDIWSIKAVLRGKFSNASENEIIYSIVAGGEIDREFFERMAKEAKDYNAAIEMLQGTKYYSILKENANNLIELEDALDLNYYNELLNTSDADLKHFGREQITILNSLNTHRAEKANIKMKEIPRGKKELVEVQAKEELDVRKEYRRMITEKGIRMLRRFKFSAAPIIGFCVAKENEVRNLRILVRGKQANLPVDTIENQLVVV